MEEENLEFLIQLEEIFGISQIDINDPYTNISAWTSMIKDILWGSLEENLAHPDVERMQSISESISGELIRDVGDWGIKDTLDSYWHEMYGLVRDLQRYVLKWILSISLSAVVPRMKELINLNNGKILTFNFTSTLEDCYQVDPSIIEHIHGGLEPYTYEVPIIGHGNKASIQKYRSTAREADEQFDEATTSIENAIADYYEETLKDTAEIIRNKRYFFQNLKTVNNIIVIGLSYSDVDMPYLQEIKRVVSPDASWTMCYFSPKSERQLDKAINQLEINHLYVTKIHSDAYLNS